MPGLSELSNPDLLKLERRSLLSMTSVFLTSIRKQQCQGKVLRAEEGDRLSQWKEDTGLLLDQTSPQQLIQCLHDALLCACVLGIQNK